jgi:hypothetical protein
MSAPEWDEGPYANEEPDLTCITQSAYVPEDHHTNQWNELSLIKDNFVPAMTIVNADDNNHGIYTGASQLLHVTLLKAEQIQSQNKLMGNVGFSVNWDGNPATAIDCLEDTGSSPTLWADRCTESLFTGRDRKSFDPKAPHFDVILISLLDSPWFPQYEKEPVEGLKPTRMDELPVESMLGRPGFVILHVGGTAIGKLEGIRLFQAWGLKMLEVILITPISRVCRRC